MPTQGFTLAQSVLQGSRGISSLNPQELGLLATDPDVARNFGELGKQAELFIQTAQPYWWAEKGFKHPTVLGKPLTGSSLLGSEYNPDQAILPAVQPTRSVVQQKAPATLPQNMAQVAAGQNGVATSGLTEMSMDELLQRSDMPMQVVGQEITRRNQIYTPELAAQRPGYFQSQFATLSAATPVSVAPVEQPPAMNQVLQDITPPVIPAVEAPIEQLPAMTEIEQEPVQAHMRQTLPAVPEQPTFDLDQVLTEIEGLINANTPQSLQLARGKYKALLAQQPNLEYGTFEDYLKTTAAPPPVIETDIPIIREEPVEQPVVAETVEIEEPIAVEEPVVVEDPVVDVPAVEEVDTYGQQMAQIDALIAENTQDSWAQALELWKPLQADNPIIGEFSVYATGGGVGAAPAGWFDDVPVVGWVEDQAGAVAGAVGDFATSVYEGLGDLSSEIEGRVKKIYKGSEDFFKQYSAVDVVEFLAEWGKYIPGPQQVYIAGLDMGFDAMNVVNALSEGQYLTAIAEIIDLVGPTSHLIKDGKILIPSEIKNTQDAKNLLYKMLGHYGERRAIKKAEEAAGLRDPEGTTDMATTPGSAVTGTGTDYLPESMEDYGKKRREYYEQYQAQPLLAQSEQQRSAIGRIRGQMMAKQGLMGSPLAVGLGTQQEAQMRGLAMQEIGRGRAEMELQLSEQAFRQNQIDRLAKQQETAELRGLFVDILQNPVVQGFASTVATKAIKEALGRDLFDPLDTIVAPDMGGPVIDTDKPLVEHGIVEDRPDMTPDKPGVGIVVPPVGLGDIEIEPPPPMKPVAADQVTLPPAIQPPLPTIPQPDAPPGDTTVPGEGTTTDLSPPISGSGATGQPTPGLYPLDWTSDQYASEIDKMTMGISGDPQAEVVVAYLDELVNSTAGMDLPTAINLMLAGFRKGFDANTAASGEEQVLGLSYPTDSVSEMMYELSSQAQNLGINMDWDEAERIIKKHLPTPRKTGAEAVPTDAGTGDLVPVDAGVVEGYRTEALNLASEIMAHPDRGLSTSIITPTEIVSSNDLVHITNVANAVINGEGSLSTLTDLIDTLQSQLTRLGSNVSPLDSQKETAQENGALQYVPLTGSAIGAAQNLHKEIEGLVNKIGFNHPDSRTIVPGRSGTLKVFDLVYSGSVLTDVLEGKRDIQDLYEIRNTLSGQASKVGTGSVSRLDTATLGFGSTSPEDMVGEAAGQMLGGAELTVNPITANEGDLAQRLENMKGNRASNGITGTGKEKEMSKEERLKNIGVMVRLAMDTNDKNLLFTAKSMHRLLKNDYPDLVEWDIFFDQAGSPAMAALLAGQTNQPQYNVRT